MITPIPEIIEALRHGETIILVDDEERENEGDLVCVAERCTPEVVNMMRKYTCGVICASLPPARAAELGLPPMVPDNTSHNRTNFTVSIDAAKNVTTGVSAHDRAEVIRLLVDPNSTPEVFVRPGHLFPITSRPGGVLERAGHTEGSSDLSRLAGFSGVGVISEITNDDGTMARLPDLEIFADKHGLKIATIRDLIAYRIETEKLIDMAVETTLPNEFGDWRMRLYEDHAMGALHTALILGEPEKQDAALVRVHSQCFTGDTLGSLRCDCGPQLKTAMKQIADEGHGVLVYMEQEGRGIGLKNKLLAYALQDKGADTIEANEALGFQADLREYGLGAQILRDLGLKKLRLLTNNPRKIVGLEAYGLEVTERVPLQVGQHKCNKRYLDTKKTKLGHLFD